MSLTPELTPEEEASYGMPAVIPSMRYGQSTLPAQEMWDYHGATTSAQDYQPNGGLQSAFQSIRRRWFWAGFLGLIAAAAGGAGTWFLFEPNYTAYATLRVAMQPPKLAFQTEDKSQRDFEIFTNTQKELIRSRYVVSAALNDSKVKQFESVREQLDPTTWLATSLQVQFPGKSELMRVSLTGESSAEVTAIVNAVVDAYLRDIVGMESKTRSDRLASLESRYSETEDKIRSRRSALRTLASTLGSGDSKSLTLKEQIMIQEYAELQKRKTEVEFDLMKAAIEKQVEETRIKMIESSVMPKHEVDRLVASDEEVKKKREEIAAMQKLLSDAEATGRDPNNPAAKGYRVRLAELQKSLEPLEQRVRDSMVPQYKQTSLTDANTKLATFNSTIELLEAQRTVLQADVDKRTQAAERIGTSSVDLEMMRAEIEPMEEVARSLASQIHELQIERFSASRVQLLDPAIEPRVLDRTRQIQVTVASMIMSFFLPGTLLCWFDSRQRRVSTSSDVSRQLGLRVIGALPMLPGSARKGGSGRGRRAKRSRMALRESIDGVRTILVKEAERGLGKTLMVTSATSGEGKTTLATQLAVSLARARLRTVIIDLDLRRPAVHRAVDADLSPGMSDVLRGQADISEIMVETSVPNLTILAAGVCDGESLEALSQDCLAQCISRLREEFDWIIIDTPPILPVVDALLISRVADAAVVSVLRDVSQIPLIQEACHRLAMLGVNVLGTVMTGSRDEVYRSDYRYEMAE